MTYSDQERDDESLIVATRRGDVAAFEILMRRYEFRLFNFIRRFIGDASEAEDLVQETFLRVHRNLWKFRLDLPFRPWVYHIATNLCRDYLRYRRRRAMISTLFGDVSPAREPAAATPGPDDCVAEQEMAARLEQALAKLSPKHRAVFLMVRYEDMSYDEVARALGVPVGTVKSRMNKAVHTLLQMIEEAK